MRRESGFTLLEVTVVMVLVSMVSYLAFEMLAQTSRVDERVGMHLREERNTGMRREWFRMLIQGLYADKADKTLAFSGSARKLEGLSTMAPTADQGRLVRFSVELKETGGDTVLQYTELGAQKAPEPVELMRWPYDRHAAFAYVTETGTHYDQWPPMTFVDKIDASAPSVILLKRIVDGRPEILSFVPRRFAEKPINPATLFGT